ncbi:MAG: hypothetical protein IT364_25975, partial [Candidatus Hydrogenedentes bacterium]|nr:hypothetical protein [Candidatus Hydrogenedentota bacterium]
MSALFFIIVLPAWAGTQEVFPLRDNGSIIAWTIAGPVAMPGVMGHGEHCIGYFQDYLGGEGAAAPAEDDAIRVEGQAIPWKTVFSNSQGFLDYARIFGTLPDFSGVAYAFCSLTSDAERQAVFKVRSNDGVRIWLNGALVHDHHTGRTVDAEEDTVAVTLVPGENRVLAKVDQSGGAWGLLLRVETPEGGPVSGVQSAVAVQRPLAREVTGFSLAATPLIRRTSEGERQVFIGEIASGGADGLVCRITKAEWEKPYEVNTGRLAAGEHRIELLTPVVTKDGPAHAQILSGERVIIETDVELAVAPRWTVYLVQHVHTDIGYTRPQTEILPEHLRYIDYALDYCDLTDSFPEDAKFRWTCETTWAVREYLKRRPQQQVERLAKRLAEGRIEVAGMFLNMAETATESGLAAGLMPLREIEDRLGAPVTLAMQNDVNGAGWCLVDYFSPIGVKYLTMGINKTRSLLPFDRPTAFWWESPTGNRIMAFRADHYHTGNNLRLHETDIHAVESRLVDYLIQLQRLYYPFEVVSLQYSGYHTDNSPPAMKSSSLIRDWNERYASPRLRCATASEPMRIIEERYGAELPVIRQAWPDWWTDGFGSAARETAAARHTHTSAQTSETFLAMASLLGAEQATALAERVQSVEETLLFYDEHTYGAAESISDPLAENTMVQWGEKGSYAWDAVKQAGMLREEALGLLQTYVPRANVPTIAVFNSLNWPRSGLIEVFIDHEIMPTDKHVQIIDPENGAPIPVQAIRTRSEGTYWALWVSNVPPLGYKSFRIEVSADPPAAQPAPNADTSVLENAFYRIGFDSASGGIKQLLDKQSGNQLVDNTAEGRLGQVVHEQLPRRDVPGQEGIEHTALANVVFGPVSVGSIWQSVQFHGELAGTDAANGVRGEVRLYETEPRIEIHFAIRKLPVTDPEGIYVAFPFALADSEVWYEAQGGMVRPGKDQIPRSASDWQTIQNFIAVRGPGNQIIFGSSEAPLVQFGGLNYGKWQEMAAVEKPHVYSWVMNNYWFTNFRASQEGEFKWSYYITSTNDISNT